ncbi:MAG TPA: hypothetical protein VGP41_16145 [Candidatus Lustribacter sp.]|nr:hypothetical protein [Candidatus Lustribacter sp.]
MIGAFWRGAAAAVIAYVIAVSAVADFLAHQCGRYWFDYTFQLSVGAVTLAFFGILGALVFLLCMIRPIGGAVQWWFWLAFAIAILIGNSLYAQTAPLEAHTATGGDLRCAIRR